MSQRFIYDFVGIDGIAPDPMLHPDPMGVRDYSADFAQRHALSPASVWRWTAGHYTRWHRGACLLVRFAVRAWWARETGTRMVTVHQPKVVGYQPWTPPGVAPLPLMGWGPQARAQMARDAEAWEQHCAAGM